MVKQWWQPAHRLDPSSPEGREQASRANKKETPPNWCAPMWELFEPMIVNAGDWLARGEPGQGDRRGQSLMAFLEPGPHRNFPSKTRMTIVLVPIGNCSNAPPIATHTECVGSFFQMPVRIGKAMEEEEIQKIKVHKEGSGYGPPLESRFGRQSFISSCVRMCMHACVRARTHVCVHVYHGLRACMHA